jgi:hypothetical protein
MAHYLTCCVDIVARSKAALTQAFLALENTVNKMGLRVNHEKTKYMLGDSRKERWKAALFGLCCSSPDALRLFQRL